MCVKISQDIAIVSEMFRRLIRWMDRLVLGLRLHRRQQQRQRQRRRPQLIWIISHQPHSVNHQRQPKIQQAIHKPHHPQQPMLTTICRLVNRPYWKHPINRPYWRLILLVDRFWIDQMTDDIQLHRRPQKRANRYVQKLPNYHKWIVATMMLVRAVSAPTMN